MSAPMAAAKREAIVASSARFTALFGQNRPVDLPEASV